MYKIKSVKYEQEVICNIFSDIGTSAQFKTVYDR